ncbi:MAG: hypothetical protein AAF591_23350 [Verrucomicrobiota bacterium]
MKQLTEWAYVFLYRTDTGITSHVSTVQDGSRAANELASNPRISADGRHVVYPTRATDLGFDNDTNGRFDDLVVKDLETGTITLLTANHDGTGTSPTGIHTNHFALSQDASVVIYTTREASQSSLPDQNFRHDLFFSRP